MMELVPVPVAVLDSSSRLGLLLVSVTITPPAGAAWPRFTVPMSWRFWPMVSSEIATPAVITVPVRELYCAGGLNPGGTLTESVAVPAASGSNCVVAVPDPPAISGRLA